ncbi:MAG: HIT domain-containing protein [Candidatus Rokubacteria bacterium]|nr:HIT domain-containing protein [Candidatus Rokubacteria bacterium]MBI2554913.1 HIT domain-containing protein [Candidatus Rokubacteria bacterium]
MDRLWAPWRIPYVGAADRTNGCLFCDALASSDDRKALVLLRRPLAFLILNAFPYASGHLMAALTRHVGTIGEATPAELGLAMALVQTAMRALDRAYHPDGYNVGLNQGRVAGAGVEGHLHIHVVPRWSGDANFMPVLGETRVLPESLEATYDRLSSALASDQ